MMEWRERALLPSDWTEEEWEPLGGGVKASHWRNVVGGGEESDSTQPNSSEGAATVGSACSCFKGCLCVCVCVGCESEGVTT
jgi:hypothetical protein